MREEIVPSKLSPLPTPVVDRKGKQPVAVGAFVRYVWVVEDKGVVKPQTFESVVEIMKFFFHNDLKTIIAKVRVYYCSKDFVRGVTRVKSGKRDIFPSQEFRFVHVEDCLETVSVNTPRMFADKEAKGLLTNNTEYRVQFKIPYKNGQVLRDESGRMQKLQVFLRLPYFAFSDSIFFSRRYRRARPAQS